MRSDWPDTVDISAIGLYAAILITLPFAGYALMVMDIRAYMRAMRRALVLVTYHFSSIPNWARQQTPPCLRALGLSLPCSSDDVKRAYRRRAERLHPDRGGDRQKFLILQRDFEASLAFLADLDESSR